MVHPNFQNQDHCMQEVFALFHFDFGTFPSRLHLKPNNHAGRLSNSLYCNDHFKQANCFPKKLTSYMKSLLHEQWSLQQLY